MDDQEKSVALAQAMGLHISDTMPICFSFDDTDYLYDLYDPASMALAWRVLNWAFVPPGTSPNIPDGSTIKSHMDYWWFHPMPGVYPTPYVKPADAQRLWLDKILELAIAANLVPPSPRPPVPQSQTGG